MQKLFIKCTLAVFIVYTLYLIFLTPPLFAQEQKGISLTINPTILEVSDKPGNKIDGKFRIRNNFSKPLTLSLHVDKVDARGKDGRVIPATPDKGDTFISWLKFDQQTFTAAPQEWTDVKYTIDVPKDAAFGYYYAIHVSQDAKDVKEKTTATVLGEVTIPLLLQIQRDGAKREAKLIEFKADQFIYEYLPVKFLTTVENKGNVHLKPRGNIFIRGAGEKDLGIVEVNQGLGNVLPGSKRTFESVWNDGFLVQELVVEEETAKLDKNGKPQMHLKINWNKITDFRFGKYTAKLVLVYDDGKRDVALESATTFWVIPYTAIGITLAGLIIALLITRLILKAYVKQQIKKHQGRN